MSGNVRNSIIFIIIVVILLFVIRGCKEDENVISELKETTSNAIEKTTDVVKDAGNVVKDAGTAVKETGQAVADGTSAAIGKLGDFFSTELPNGTALSIPKFGVENKLIGFIESDEAADKDTWFEFDRINFPTGKTGLSEDSSEQLDNIAEILAAYPNVNIKIGGYTDNTGSENVNMRLSQARADSIKRVLVRRGITAERLTAEGYGSAHAVASNDTEEGRAQNRRIALRVTAK